MGHHHDQEELIALKTSIIGLFSTVNRKNYVQQQRDYHQLKIDEHRAKVQEMNAELARMEEEHQRGTKLVMRLRLRATKGVGYDGWDCGLWGGLY